MKSDKVHRRAAKPLSLVSKDFDEGAVSYLGVEDVTSGQNYSINFTIDHLLFLFKKESHLKNHNFEAKNVSATFHPRTRLVHLRLFDIVGPECQNMDMEHFLTGYAKVNDKNYRLVLHGDAVEHRSKISTIVLLRFCKCEKSVEEVVREYFQIDDEGLADSKLPLSYSSEILLEEREPDEEYCAQ